VAAFLVSTQTFGHIEFALLRERVRLTTRALATRESDSENSYQERRIRLQGSDDWERLWIGLTESAERYALTSVRLTIDVPALHQSFFGTWQLNPEQRSGAAARGCVWTVETPLAVDGRSVGHLTISGRPGDRPTLGHISQVVDFAEPIEDDIRQIIAKLVPHEGVKITDSSAPAQAKGPASTRRSVIAGARPTAVDAAPSQAIATSGPSS